MFAQIQPCSRELELTKVSILSAFSGATMTRALPVSGNSSNLCGGSDIVRVPSWSKACDGYVAREISHAKQVEYKEMDDETRFDVQSFCCSRPEKEKRWLFSGYRWFYDPPKLMERTHAPGRVGLV